MESRDEADLHIFSTCHVTNHFGQQEFLADVQITKVDSSNQLLYGCHLIHLWCFQPKSKTNQKSKCAQISVIPKPELRGFGGIPLLNHNLR